MNRTVLNAYKKIGVEMNKQVNIILPAAAVVLWKQFGWRKVRILRRLVTTSKVVNECGQMGPMKSVMQMLEEETGIELQLSGYPSYHEFSYLDSNKWDGKGLTKPQMVAMYGKMAKWIAPQIIAGICLALYRDEGFGAERLGRFISGLDAIRKELGEVPKSYKELLEKETDIKAADLQI